MPTAVAMRMANRSTTMRLLLILTIAAIPGLSAGPTQAAPKHPHALVSRTIVARATALLRDSIAALSTRSGPGDQQYFANGVWHSPDNSIWNYNIGPGSAAAALWQATGRSDTRLRSLAIQTFDTVISTRRHANGSFGAANDGPDITSMMVGVELGTAYLDLQSTLGRRRADRWRNAVVGAADFLIRNGNLTWYTNGNINIGNTELFYLAWRASGATRFWRAYNQSWAFTLHPPQSRWPGFGLHLLTARLPAGGDRGAAGYLAESGGRRPGFDPEYAGVQLDVVSRLYVLSGDPRALRLANLLTNALLPRVGGTWLLNTSGGTRHPWPDRHVAFMTPGLATVGWLGGRSDIATDLSDQFARIDEEYRAAMSYGSANMYHGLGSQVAVILLAAMRADGPCRDASASGSAGARPGPSGAWLRVRTLSAER
jgi:hypothetical protein